MFREIVLHAGCDVKIDRAPEKDESNIHTYFLLLRLLRIFPVQSRHTPSDSNLAL